MSKHRLDAPLPPAKRQHITNTPPIRVTTSLDGFSDELLLSIFSFLGFIDLCGLQSTCHTWARLALDNELWKYLYLRAFGGRTRLRGARGFIGRTDGREIKPLPGRAAAKPSADVTRNWKWMFRISRNWRTGRCKLESLDTVAQPSGSSSTLQRRTETMHILLAGSLTITASPQASSRPNIRLQSGKTHHSLSIRSTVPGAQPRITALTLDQARPDQQCLRLVACISTSEIFIFDLDLRHLERSSLKMSNAVSRRRPGTLVQVAYHHPLLITLSDTFNLSMYDLFDDVFVHRQSLSSFSTFPPTSFVLSRPTASTYKLVMAYSIPVYPVHWSVGVTEIIVAGPAGPSSPSLPSSQEMLSSFVLPSPTPMSVISTRTTRALDVPQGWIDEVKLKAMRDQWGRKVQSVAETQTDGRWVILAPGQDVGATSPHARTTLQLYKLSLPGNSTSSSPKLVFVRSLHGQTGQTTALALSDGRCVSLSHNGSIWVWDLEGSAPGAQVSQATMHDTVQPDTGKGSVAFDDRKIVSSSLESVVQVRRFDV